jgi:hypothetical protein
MLAAIATAVKFSATQTSEQVAVEEATSIFWTLVKCLHAAAEQQRPIHRVEETIFRQLLMAVSALRTGRGGLCKTSPVWHCRSSVPRPSLCGLGLGLAMDIVATYPDLAE